MVVARLLSITASAERKMPAIELLAQLINSSVAPGAAAPAHSVSSAASVSSLVLVIPGSEQEVAPAPCSTVKLGVAGVTPIVVRKLVTSAVWMSVSSSSATVMPEPLIVPPAISGLSL